MAEKLVMPKMGLTMTEGKIIKWYKNEGEDVKENEELYEVVTDKITNIIESTISGKILKILIKEGETAKVKDTIAIIGLEGEDISSFITQPDVKEVVEKDVIVSPKKEKIKQTKNIKISPYAKKLAKEKGIDITEIHGTGPNGRIIEKDIQEFENKNSKKTTAMADKASEYLEVDTNKISKETRIMKDDVIEFYKNNKIEEYAAPYEKTEPMTEMRKIISQRMSQSWNISPAVSYDISIDVSNIAELKNIMKPYLKLTYTDIIVKILSKVLLKHKELNSQIQGDNIIYRNYVHMSVAVAIEDGLMVPVIKYSNQKGLRQISKEIKELAEKAKSNTLTMDDLTGGTFTITNVGKYGIEAFSPIINQPQVAILGICSIKNTPIVNEKMEIEIKPIMKICLTADHRAVDGAVAAEFLQDLKIHLENPAMLLV